MDIEKILDNCKEGIWITDSNGIILYVNNTLMNIFNYAENEIIGESYLEFVQNDNLKIAKKIFERTKRGISEECDLTFSNKSDNPLIAKIYKTPIFNENGEFEGEFTVFLDYIEKSKYVRKKRETKRMMSSIINNLPGMAYRCKNNKNWTMTYLSEGCYDITGYYPIDFLFDSEINYNDLILEEDIAHIKNEINLAIKNERPFHIIYRIKHASGQIKWVSDQGRSVKIKNEKKMRIEGYIHDISELKKTQENLLRTKQKYKEAYQRAEFYKDLFAHDVSNILQSILSGTSLIEIDISNSKNKEISKESIEIIKDQVRRATNLVSNIRKISEIEQKSLKYAKKNVLDLLEATIEELKEIYKKKKINIKCDVKIAKLKSFIEVNELFKDIFENILHNAIIHNDNENVDICIRVNTQYEENQGFLRIEFIDNGRGIHNSQKEIILHRNYRDSKSKNGIGLGLSLVNLIVLSMKGRIWVEDKIEGDFTQGAKVVILIPEDGKS